MKKLILTFLFLTFTTTALLAQAPPPPPGNAGAGGGPVGSPTGAPIDGGTGILLLLGAAYGVRKLRL